MLVRPSDLDPGTLLCQSATALVRRCTDRVLVLTAGEVHTLAGSAVDIWDALDEPSTVDHVVDRLRERYGNEVVRSDVEQVILWLLDAEALVGGSS